MHYNHYPAFHTRECSSHALSLLPPVAQQVRPQSDHLNTDHNLVTLPQHRPQSVTSPQHRPQSHHLTSTQTTTIWSPHLNTDHNLITSPQHRPQSGHLTSTQTTIWSPHLNTDHSLVTSPQHRQQSGHLTSTDHNLITSPQQVKPQSDQVTSATQSGQVTLTHQTTIWTSHINMLDHNLIKSPQAQPDQVTSRH